MKNQEQEFVFNKISASILWVIAAIVGVSVIGLLFPFMFQVLKFYLALYPDQLTFSTSYNLVTYGLLHSDYGHLGLNMVWLLIFATPLQRYFGTQSFLIIFMSGIIAGGGFFLTYDNHVEIIGASAGVSACSGASLRFMLKPKFDFQGKPQLYSLTDGRFLLPTGLFFIFDIISAFLMSSTGHFVAWQAHIIGYIVGALLMESKYINKRAIRHPYNRDFE